MGVVTVEGGQIASTLFGPIPESIMGSGFVVVSAGANYVVTNFHVVDGTTGLSVTFYDGNGYRARVEGTDPYSDLAILSVPDAPATEYHSLSFASSSTLVVGEPVIALGNPYGLTGSITTGIISHTGRTITESAAGNYSIANVIQFSAPVNPGNSGSPLLNSNGMVVGMITATVESSQGLGLAVPSDTITKELTPLIKTGTYNLHSYIGIRGIDMSYALANEIGTNITYGVLIEAIIPGSPASAAGLHAGTEPVTVQGTNYLIGGDIVVSMNAVKILNNDALAAYLEANTTPGQTVQLGLLRSGHLTTVPITLGTRPPPPS
jgi:S1-C subfamily serine protease